MDNKGKDYSKKIGTVIGWGIGLTICAVIGVAVVVAAIKAIQWLIGLL